MNAATLSKGNAKTGRSIVTVSRTPGDTCPGASDWCNALLADGACYAKKAFTQYTQTRNQWSVNASVNEAPAMPARKRNGAQINLRIHVSGDFDTVEYIESWIAALAERPDITAWAYTRSWRVEALVDALEALRALPNMQLFASLDPTIEEMPPVGWRIAAIEGDGRVVGPICMEQTGAKADCASCGYCFKGQRNNVIFKAH